MIGCGSKPKTYATLEEFLDANPIPAEASAATMQFDNASVAITTSKMDEYIQSRS